MGYEWCDIIEVFAYLNLVHASRGATASFVGGPAVFSSPSATQEINLMLCQDHKDQTSGEISLNHWNAISFI